MLHLNQVSPFVRFCMYSKLKGPFCIQTRAILDYELLLVDDGEFTLVYDGIPYDFKKDDIVLIQRKDYIANPKPNGYRSLHLIVEIPIFLHDEKKMMKVEVQLRTISMDWWASLEHKFRYKKDIEISEEIDRELKECAEAAAILDRKMESIQRKIPVNNEDAYEW